MNDLQVLISEYNEVEATQGARLRAIYELLRAQAGYHCVKFSDQTMWGASLFKLEDRSIVDNQIGNMVRLITDCQ